jgi:hypothetical protein
MQQCSHGSHNGPVYQKAKSRNAESALLRNEREISVYLLSDMPLRSLRRDRSCPDTAACLTLGGIYCKSCLHSLRMTLNPRFSSSFFALIVASAPLYGPTTT